MQTAQRAVKVDAVACDRRTSDCHTQLSQNESAKIGNTSLHLGCHQQLKQEAGLFSSALNLKKRSKRYPVTDGLRRRVLFWTSPARPWNQYWINIYFKMRLNLSMDNVSCIGWAGVFSNYKDIYSIQIVRLFSVCSNSGNDLSLKSDRKWTELKWSSLPGMAKGNPRSYTQLISAPLVAGSDLTGGLSQLIDWLKLGKSNLLSPTLYLNYNLHAREQGDRGIYLLFFCFPFLSLMFFLSE